MSSKEGEGAISVRIARAHRVFEWHRPPSARKAKSGTAPGLFIMGVALASVLVGGCSFLKHTHSQDTAEVETVQAKANKPGSRTLASLQLDVMRFADDYAATVAQAADDFSSACTNTQHRMMALRWKLEMVSAGYVNATGRNPTLNAVDMVVLATLSRMVIESLAGDTLPEEEVQPLLRSHRQMESNAWGVVEGVLKTQQKTELADLMREWRKNNPAQRYVGGIRFKEFAAALGKTPQETRSKPSSIFNLLFIDPMAGLDPTARAIEETRQSAERITYYAQRAPILWSWQAELLTYQVSEQPAAQQLLASGERLSNAAEAFAGTAEKLPDLVSREREAAIRQLLDGVALERTNLLAALASEEGKLRGVLAEVRQTLEAGGTMAKSVDDAVRSLDAFVRLVSPGLGTNSAGSPSGAADDTSKRPFDVLDYGKAASQVGAMANDLNALLRSVNQSLPQAAQLGDKAQSDVRRILDHAFWRGVLLILIGLTASVVAALVYRRLSGAAMKRGESRTNDVQRHEAEV